MDTSRQFLDTEAEDALIAHSKAQDLAAAVKRLFSADIVNPSENRPALHWALRSEAGVYEGEAETVRASLTPALAFADKVRSEGTYKAVIHIGIGGSDFGPRLILDAFAPERQRGIDVRLCANVDPLDLERAMDGLDPATTLVIGVSKSFGTEETLYNLSRARDWLKTALGDDWPEHLALITASRERAERWLGKPSTQIFDMPLSVGGRFSMWSTASLACIISLGPDLFRSILSGARAMDTHVQSAEIGDNLPMLLALLDYWNASVRGEDMRVALAYASRLRLLPTYLQQLEMESNGKSVTPTGSPVAGQTAPALWGGEGSIGQHSYHQWLHQGAHAVPTEFILALDAGAEAEGQTALIAHALAQAEVLANGRSLEEITSAEPELAEAIARQKVHPGGRPSTLLTCRAFGPEAFGALIALYEHRTYLAGVLWGVNSFDQWGVERGKTMAGRIKSALTGEASAPDAVTADLVSRLRNERA